MSKKSYGSAIVNPHDKVFKIVMSDIRVAKDFFIHYLPKNIRQCINLDTLRIANGSFIDDDLKVSEVDVLYEVNFKNKSKSLYLYLLLEHLSKPDKWIAFRLVKYQCRIADQYLKQNPKIDGLPIIMPIIFYNGSGKYNYSTCILELFKENKALAKDLYSKPFKLVDLNLIPDAKLRQHQWSGLLEMVMKHIKARNFLIMLEEIGEFFIKPLLYKKHTETYMKNMVDYIINEGEINNTEIFFQRVKQYVQHNKVAEKQVMTIAEQLKKQGRQEGKREGQQLIIQQLYNKLRDINEVASLSGLSVQEVTRLLNLDERSGSH